MPQISSLDGTRIGYERSGSGPPLLLVHGTASDHTRWARVAPALSARLSVYAMDRRGRGLSEDGDAYAIEHEAEDIRAVMGAIGGKVDLLGHSFGAACALEVARQSGDVRRLLLYDPPPPGALPLPPGLIDHLEALLAAGEREAATITFLQAFMAPQEIDELRAAPVWPQRVAAAHTIVREQRALAAAPPLDRASLAAVAAPTLLLRGGASPASAQAHADALHAALPKSQVVTMPGQRHLAMHTAPELFAREVLAFLAAAG